jgi:hypothetical protein
VYSFLLFLLLLVWWSGYSLSTLFSETFILYSFLTVRDKVSYPFRTTLYIFRCSGVISAQNNCYRTYCVVFCRVQTVLVFDWTGVTILGVGQDCTNFPKIHDPPENSRHKKGGMKQVPSWGPTNVRHHYTKVRHLGDLVPRICAPLVYVLTVDKNIDLANSILGTISVH